MEGCLMKRVPNILTLIRLFLIPFYLAVFYSDIAHPVRWAMIIFLIASLTDIVDGYIARKFDAISKFGQVADPFADKVMQISVLFSLADINYIEKWFFWIILVKEAFQIMLSIAMLSVKPKVIMPANIFGKVTTVLIFATIILSLFRLPWLIYLQMFVSALAIITFLQYAYRASRIMKDRRDNPQGNNPD
jgi:cardiolipin synthase (CMP-forming)